MFFWRQTLGSNSFNQGEQPLASQRLLEGARRGEAEPLSTLYRQFLPGVFGYVAARVPDRSTAEDLTSEVFLKMVESIGHLRADNETGVAAWLLQIARATVAGYYRKRDNQFTYVPFEPTSWEEEEETDSRVIPTSHPDADPVRRAEAQEEWSTVVNAINLLTEEQRQVLISRLILGYDVTTVAQIIGKNNNAVKALQFRALHSLHRLLRREPMHKRTAHVAVRHQEEEDVTS